ncbi:MAG: ABC transporter permease subunit [Lachnospiraceae bacterium]|nr:ABC transporter permease subunit [Lachnospiraceae bacterium]
MRHLNPVYKIGLKQSARTKKTVVLLLVYNLLLSGLGLVVFYLTFDRAGRVREDVAYSGILTLYSVMAAMEFVMILFIVPASTAGAVAGEREKQTLDILLSTKITPFHIVTGKLAASISMVILLVISSMPVLSVVFCIGGVTVSALFVFLLLLVVTAVYIGSFGIFFSVCCRKTTGATVCAYLAMIIVVILLPGLLFFFEFLEAFGSVGYIGIRNVMNTISGKRTLFLLFNPVISFVSMLRDQVGRGISIMNSIGSEGGLFYFLSRHWFAASMVSQLVVSAIMIALSAHRLNPTRKGWKSGRSG